MGIEEFPEIETFQRLPKRVLVKGGASSVNAQGEAELSGIIINNLGQPIKDVKVYLIIFDEQDIPLLNVTTSPLPSFLPQGGISSFKFTIQDYKEKIDKYHLYANWKYDDSRWVI